MKSGTAIAVAASRTQSLDLLACTRIAHAHATYPMNTHTHAHTHTHTHAHTHTHIRIHTHTHIRTQAKLQWYAENQDMLNQHDDLMAEQRQVIQQLQARLAQYEGEEEGRPLYSYRASPVLGLTSFLWQAAAAEAAVLQDAPHSNTVMH